MDIIEIITIYLASALTIATPLTLAGIGAAFSEKTGVLNIGLEAIMLSAAFFSFITYFATSSFLLGIVAGIIGGVVVSLIHGTLSITFRADQTIVSIALNFLILGLTSFLFLKTFGQSTVLPDIDIMGAIEIPVLSKIPIIGQVLFNQNLFVYIMIIMVIAIWYVFYRTEWGVRISAVGENPRAADNAGINVDRVRYSASIINGIMGGIAGSYIILAKLGFFIENITSGKGYIALVAVILGRRNPVGILLVSLIIGLAETVQFKLQAAGTAIPSQFFSMLPYVVAVIVLMFSIGRNNTPSALGIPYDRNKR